MSRDVSLLTLPSTNSSRKLRVWLCDANVYIKIKISGLFFLSWVVDSIVINRHRKAGLPCKPVKRRASFADGSQTRSMKVSPPMKPRTKKPRRGLSAIFGFGSDGGAGGGGGGYDGGCDGGGGGDGGCDGG